MATTANSRGYLTPSDTRETDSRGAAAILRGVQRLLRAQNFESISELSLGNGRRADVIAISPGGDIWIIEIKSSITDFRTEYRDYCDQLSFAVAPGFPAEILPEDTGLILADAYGGEVIRGAPRHQLAPQRRKALMLSVARTAAMRLNALLDPTGRF